METHRFKRLSRADRYDVQILGNISLEKDGEKQESYICNTVNVSLTGALVETSSRIPVGSLLKYTFRMPGFSVPVNVIGEIVRGVRDAPAADKEKPRGRGGRKKKPEAEAPPKKINRYGIIFLDMNEQDKLALEIYLVQNRKKPLTEAGPDADPDGPEPS